MPLAQALFPSWNRRERTLPRSAIGICGLQLTQLLYIRFRLEPGKRKDPRRVHTPYRNRGLHQIAYKDAQNAHCFWKEATNSPTFSQKISDAACRACIST